MGGKREVYNAVHVRTIMSGGIYIPSVITRERDETKRKTRIERENKLVE